MKGKRNPSVSLSQSPCRRDFGLSERRFDEEWKRGNAARNDLLKEDLDHDDDVISILDQVVPQQAQPQDKGPNGKNEEVLDNEAEKEEREEEQDRDEEAPRGDADVKHWNGLIAKVHHDPRMNEMFDPGLLKDAKRQAKRPVAYANAVPLFGSAARAKRNATKRKAHLQLSGMTRQANPVVSRLAGGLAVHNQKKRNKGVVDSAVGPATTAANLLVPGAGTVGGMAASAGLEQVVGKVASYGVKQAVDTSVQKVQTAPSSSASAGPGPTAPQPCASHPRNSSRSSSPSCPRLTPTRSSTTAFSPPAPPGATRSCPPNPRSASPHPTERSSDPPSAAPPLAGHPGPPCSGASSTHTPFAALTAPASSASALSSYHPPPSAHSEASHARQGHRQPDPEPPPDTAPPAVGTHSCATHRTPATGPTSPRPVTPRNRLGRTHPLARPNMPHRSVTHSVARTSA